VTELSPERVEEVVGALDRGERRVAAKRGGEWIVDEEAKAAIIGYFRLALVPTLEECRRAAAILEEVL